MNEPKFPLVFERSTDQKPTTYSLNDTGRGLGFTAQAGNGHAASALIPLLDEASPCAQIIAYVGECAKAFVGDIAQLHERFKGEELTNRVRGAAIARFAKSLGQLQNQGIRDARDVAISYAGLTAVDPATIGNAHLRVEAMRKWNAADQASRETIATNDETPYETTAALIETGALNNVSDRARDTAIERYREQRLIAKSGSTAAHELQPSYERPLAFGADHQAARKAAKLEIDKLKARSEAIAMTEDLLRNICSVIAIATDMQPRDFYALFDRK